MTETLETVAAKLVENERGIGQLYELFAAAFPDDAPLWSALGQEEQQHAEWIRQAVEAMPADTRQQPVPAIRSQAIGSMMAYVASVRERCRRKELSRLNAFALARDIENSLLEGRLLESLKTPVAGVDKDLLAATAVHRRRIVEAMQRLPQ
ncbi:MAG: hypothetical protein ACM3NQ_18500 [Bacteroidales bacterium]